MTKKDFSYKNIPSKNAFYKLLLASDSFSEESFENLSITMPFKEEVVNFSECKILLSSETVYMNSCNTIKKIGSILFGYNTDYLAMYYLLINRINKNSYRFPNYQESMSKGTKSFNFLIIGAGGACVSVIFSLIKMNISNKNIFLFNRNEEKARKIIQKYDIRLHNDCEDEIIYDIVISTIPKHVNIEFYYSVNFKTNIVFSLFFDLAYTEFSHKTGFYQYIYDKYHLYTNEERCGLYEYINGVDFLIVQGKYQFEIFSGKRIECITWKDEEEYLKD